MEKGGAFCFLDEVTEFKHAESLAAMFRLSGTEEFLKDHFENFPVMPGVLLLESLKQAAVELLNRSGRGDEAFYRLESAQDVKFGQFVKPGSELRISVRRLDTRYGREIFDGRIDVSGQKALSASFTITRV